MWSYGMDAGCRDRCLRLSHEVSSIVGTKLFKSNGLVENM